MSVAFRPIQQVSNPETILRRIRHASADMFVREFCKNALEASSFAEHPRVKWWQFTEGGYRKLYVWNNGVGMDADDLIRVMDLSASGREKTQGIDGNYGQGAKLTGLRANNAGLLWRTCKDGVVSQLLLGWEDNVPGIIPQGDDDDTAEHVLDVSELYGNVMLSEFDKDLFAATGERPMLSFDWTMVVFLGNDISQDTVADPWGNGHPGDGAKDYWLVNKINRRFYDLRGCGVTAINTTSSVQGRNCEGLYHIPVEQEETVLFENFRIRYCVLKGSKSRSSEAAKGYGGHCALVFRNEVYEPLFGGDWNSRSSQFGVWAGQGRIAIQIVLADDYNASPNEQRMQLERELPYAKREQITLDEFEDLVEENLPQFIRDFADSQRGPKRQKSEKVSQRIKQLMQDLQFRTVSPQHDGETPIGEAPPTEGNCPAQPASESGNRPSDGGGGGGGNGGSTDGDSEKPKREKRPSNNLFGRLGKPVATGVRRKINEEPDYDWQDGGEDEKYVGKFDEKHNTLILYRNHPVLSETCNAAMSEYNIPAKLAEEVQLEAESWIAYAGLRHVIYAKSLVRDDRLDEPGFAMATSPQALTASIGYSEMHIQPVEIAFRTRREKS